MKKIPKCTMTMLLIILLITACSTNSGLNNSQALKTIVKDMDYLTSDLCGGRRPGTPGNEAAQNYINKRFEEIGLVPFDKEFSMPYEATVVNIAPDSIKMDITEGGVSIENFTYGKDFIEINLEESDFTLPLLLEPNNSDCAILTDNIGKAMEYSKNSHVKLLLIKKENMSRNAYSYKIGKVPEVGVYGQAYDRIKSRVGKTIRFSSSPDVANTTLKNSIGLIEGKNRENALIISAHFDHIGSIGKPGEADYFIWKGAFDNASGICALLDTAKCLKSLYKDDKPAYDIVFCAFNGEEAFTHTLSGSKAFVGEIDGKYKSFFDINIDCIGNMGNSTLIVDANKSKGSTDVAQKIADKLKSLKSDAKAAQLDIVSDNMSFSDAVLITTISDLAKSNVHTLQDTPDKIDIDFIKETGDKLAAAIKELAESIDFKNVTSTTTDHNIITNTNLVPIANISPDDFEKRFNVKLDFIDKNSIVGIIVTPKIRIATGKQNQDKKSENIPQKIKDIYVIHMLISKDNGKTPVIISSFYVYEKNNSLDMDIYKTNLELSGYDNKSQAKPINTTNHTYYVFPGEYNDLLTLEQSTEKLIIDFSASNPELENKNSIDQYKDFIADFKIDKCVDGMMKLLQQGYEH